MTRRIVKAELRGLAELEQKMLDMPEKVGVGIVEGLEIIGRIILNRATDKIMRGPKTGVRYRRGGVVHQSSAPGEAPASDTGRLVGSGTTWVDAASLSAIVAFDVKYARLLEFGTRFIRPRPFLFPVVDAMKADIVEILKESIRGALLR